MSSAPDANMPEVGTVLAGRYRLIRLLGAGGMGWVFEGVHERLKRPVAIKVLKPGLAGSDEFKIRFEREARAAALLKSRHAVRVFDIDVMPDGGMCIAMELLTGRDLGKEAIDKGGLLDPRDLVGWIVQACEALHEAHSHGIIHRDIKPANIFLADEDGERIAKVVDFGISKFTEQATKRALTDPDGAVLGTPYYMAPELLRGHRIDGRADIWAIGVTLYRILAGRLPFTAAASSNANIGYMSAVLTEAPHPLAELRPDLSFELARVIMRTLEKRPDDRFASAKDLAAELRPFGRHVRTDGSAGASMAGDAASLTPQIGSFGVDTVKEEGVEGGGHRNAADSRHTAPMHSAAPAGARASQAELTMAPQPESTREVARRPLAIVVGLVFLIVGVAIAIAIGTRADDARPRGLAGGATIEPPNTPPASSSTKLLTVESAPIADPTPQPTTPPPMETRVAPPAVKPKPRPSAPTASSLPPDYVPPHL